MLASCALLATLELALPAPDPDYCAHMLWGRLAAAGTVPRISVDAAVDDCSIYYPDTVPKPAQLLLVTLAELAGGGAAHAILRILLAAAAVLAAASVGMRTAGGPRGAVAAGLVIGLHPAFVLLALGGSPSIPFLALLFLSNPLSCSAAAFFRPEGAAYAAVALLRRRSPAAIAVLAAALLSWPVVNLLMAGSATWSAREVIYAVAAMPFPTPGPVGFWPWAALRGLLVAGPVLLVSLLLRIRSWPHAPAAGIHLLMLCLSLAAGSLALPRYVDQIFLLSIPWALGALGDFTVRLGGRRAVAVTWLALAGTTGLWAETAGAIRSESLLGRELDRTGSEGFEGRLAANELLVPRIALAAGILDPSERFVALDRMIYEGREPLELGVGRIVVCTYGIYLPARTSDWLAEDHGVPVDTIGPLR